MTQSRSRAQIGFKIDSRGPKRLDKASSPKPTTRPSISPSSSVIKTNGSSSHGAKNPRMRIEAEDNYDEITINKIKGELRQRRVPVPNKKNKPFLFELLVDAKWKQDKIRNRDNDMAELKKLLAKHGNLLESTLVKAIEKAYKVPTAIEDKRSLPVKVNEASQQDRVRCSQIKQLKATQALFGHTISAEPGSIKTQRASVQLEHYIADDGDSASSAPHEVLVDPNSNTPYDAVLYCREPHNNVDKFYHLEVSNHTFVRFHFTPLYLHFSCRINKWSRHGHLAKVHEVEYDFEAQER